MSYFGGRGDAGVKIGWFFLRRDVRVTQVKLRMWSLQVFFTFSLTSFVDGEFFDNVYLKEVLPVVFP